MSSFLRKFFKQEHLTDPRNLLECDKCKKAKPNGVLGTKEFFLYDPPKILNVQLKRFRSSGYSLSKNSMTIENLEYIYLDDYVLLDGNKKKFVEKIRCMDGKPQQAL